MWLWLEHAGFFKASLGKIMGNSSVNLGYCQVMMFDSPVTERLELKGCVANARIGQEVQEDRFRADLTEQFFSSESPMVDHDT